MTISEYAAPIPLGPEVLKVQPAVVRRDPASQSQPLAEDSGHHLCDQPEHQTDLPDGCHPDSSQAPGQAGTPFRPPVRPPQKGGQAADAARDFASPADVAAAYKSGRLTRAQAEQILRYKFGVQQ